MASERMTPIAKYLVGLLPKEKPTSEAYEDKKHLLRLECVAGQINDNLHYNAALADVRAILEKVEMDTNVLKNIIIEADSISECQQRPCEHCAEGIAHTLSQAEGLLKLKEDSNC